MFIRFRKVYVCGISHTWDVFITSVYSSKSLRLLGTDYGYTISILNDIK